MKIELIGSGCTWNRRLATSFVIDEHILIDCPQGSFKKLFCGRYLEKVDTILISHFHSDHWADLHLVIEVLMKTKRSKKIKLFAPATFLDRLKNICLAFEVGHNYEKFGEYFEYTELSDGKIFKISNLSVKSFKMSHIDIDCFGFLLNDGKACAGFSSDTKMCDNLIKIIEKSNAVFIDMASTSPNQKHLCYNEVINLQKQYENVKFYPVHLSSASIARAKGKIELTRDGQIVML